MDIISPCCIFLLLAALGIALLTGGDLVVATVNRVTIAILEPARSDTPMVSLQYGDTFCTTPRHDDWLIPITNGEAELA